MQVRPVGDVVPSPDGKLVAYTESRAVIEAEKSEVDTQIFLAAADGSHRTQLTRGEKSATAPEFSPDGRLHLFLFRAQRQAEPLAHPVDGGEAEMLTDWKGEIGRIPCLAGRQVDRICRHGDRAPTKRSAKKEKRDFRVIDENPKNHSLWIIPPSRTARESAPRASSATRPATCRSSTGRRIRAAIAFAHTPTPGADDWTKSDISEVTVESGAVRADRGDRRGRAQPAAIRRTDVIWLFVRSTDPARWAGIDRIVLLTRAERRVARTAADFR